MRKKYDNKVFIIDEKDEKVFERAKKLSGDIYFMIENLEFFRVDFVIESDLREELKK